MCVGADTVACLGKRRPFGHGPENQLLACWQDAVLVFAVHLSASQFAVVAGVAAAAGVAAECRCRGRGTGC